jgi:hypothetical protein
MSIDLTALLLLYTRVFCLIRFSSVECHKTIAVAKSIHRLCRMNDMIDNYQFTGPGRTEQVEVIHTDNEIIRNCYISGHLAKNTSMSSYYK